MRPHRRQPTRLSGPWDSQGKNTGVGCHFLLQFMKVKSESEVAQSCPTLSDPMDCSPPGSSVCGIFQARVLEWGAIAFSSLIMQLCLNLCNPMDCSIPGSSVYGDYPGKNTRVGCHALLQGIFPTQGSNPGLPHWRQIIHSLSHQGSPGYVLPLKIYSVVDSKFKTFARQVFEDLLWGYERDFISKNIFYFDFLFFWWLLMALIVKMK